MGNKCSCFNRTNTENNVTDLSKINNPLINNGFISDRNTNFNIKENSFNLDNKSNLFLDNNDNNMKNKIKNMTKEEKIDLIYKNIKSFLLKLNFKRKIKPELIKFSEDIFQSFYKNNISNQKLTNLLSNENSNIINININEFYNEIPMLITNNDEIIKSIKKIKTYKYTFINDNNNYYENDNNNNQRRNNKKFKINLQR